MRLGRKSVGILVMTLVSAILFSSFISVNVLADGGWDGGTTVPVENNTDNDTHKHHDNSARNIAPAILHCRRSYLYVRSSGIGRIGSQEVLIWQKRKAR